MRLSPAVLTGLPLVALACVTSSCGSAPPPEGSTEEMRYLVREAISWRLQERLRHRAQARPLAVVEHTQLAPFFPTETLDQARVVAVDAIDNPDFIEAYRRHGREMPLDFSRARGLALIDTILITDKDAVAGSPALQPLLFHELVHVEQNRQLGHSRFLSCYIHNWASHDRRYRANPFESQAFALTARFVEQRELAFSVAEEVRQLVDSMEECPV